ncbi:ATP-binding cassette domain-containing protein [Lipingzhangella sp. LS1_29]|uniref:ATP-binding cassette domain-containing protein n=1 Tax=Lipingzhangella rawalii TaxID=2055835 RepID=A0ABU2HAQ5_9ACTN|nr:oligopeptide/dipeptide ABC transporter ATP-binding protein [Lipingzhangella rawalii]MDS1272407.1 ATP-binding cassette domain-containing protein [Lipingzhangella rawalii]
MPAETDIPAAGTPGVHAGAADDTATQGHGEPALLETRGLEVHFPVRRRGLRRTAQMVRAVDGVDLRLDHGETLGLVGESGCGKTTLGSAVLGLRSGVRGAVYYRSGQGRLLDATRLGSADLAEYRQEVRMIFQDPHASLNPRLTLLDLVGEPLRVLQGVGGAELEERVAGILERVGLRRDHLRRYPHAFSGGERQRVSIARALVPGPRLVVADEAVSALDVSVRSQILNLLQDLQDEMGLTYLFVSHDLSVVEHVCTRVAVMYLGRVVEQADTSELYGHPRHPYTEALISAVPVPDPRLRGRRERIRLTGELPDPASPPSGCPFHTRCGYATERCAIDRPPLREITPGHRVACHHAEELSLAGLP